MGHRPLPPFDHPHIFIRHGGDNEAVCLLLDAIMFMMRRCMAAVPGECVYEPAAEPETLKLSREPTRAR